MLTELDWESKHEGYFNAIYKIKQVYKNKILQL